MARIHTAIKDDPFATGSFVAENNSFVVDVWVGLNDSADALQVSESPLCVFGFSLALRIDIYRDVACGVGYLYRYEGICPQFFTEYWHVDADLWLCNT